MKEKQSRSVIKAITYRVSATFATFGLAYAFTGSLEIASQIGLLDFIIKFIIYYLNERIWNKTTWGYYSSTGKKEVSTKQNYLSKRKRLARLEH